VTSSKRDVGDKTRSSRPDTGDVTGGHVTVVNGQYFMLDAVDGDAFLPSQQQRTAVLQ